MSEQRIRWNEDECGRLADAALALLVADRKTSVVEAVRRVQDTVLPPERRRNLPTIGMVPVDLRTTLEQRRAAATGETKLVNVEELLRAQERIGELSRLLDAERGIVSGLRTDIRFLEAEIARLKALPTPPDPIDVVKGFCADVLALAARKTKEMPETLAILETSGVRAEQARGDSPGQVRHDPEPKGDGKPKPPVVLCVGVKAQDRPRLESLMNGKVRLKFWTDESYSMLDDKARTADMCFVMMSLASHDTVAKVAKNNPNYQRIPGHAVDRLRDEIDAWLERRARSAA